MISVGKIHGMTKEDEELFRELLKEFNAHEDKNKEKQRYYEGAIRLSEVNLGIALPQNIRGLEIGCEWGAKTVDVLAARSIGVRMIAEIHIPSKALHAPSLESFSPVIEMM